MCQLQKRIMKSPNDLTVNRTPAKGCYACETRTRHTPEQLKTYHPFAGHGMTLEGGWSHPELGEKK
jgi:hypothetical protein